MGKLLCERIEKIDSAAVCSDPYFIIRLLVKAENGVVAQSPVVARHYVRVGHHRHFADADQSVTDTSGPHIVVLVVVEAQNGVGGE